MQSYCFFFLSVVLDSSGKSRGFGFVRFAEESDQVKALIEMQNYKGLGSKPIRVAVANPKRYFYVILFNF